jgi:hypothetical protein
LEENKVRGTHIKRLLDEMNEIRSDPQGLAIVLKEEYLDLMDEKGLHEKNRILYNEGRSAFEDAIRFLREQPAQPRMKMDLGLTVCAFTHSKFMSSIKKVTHTGSDGGEMFSRIREYGQFLSGSCSENALSMKEMDYQEICVRLIIDDGVPSRAHRKNFFNPSFQLIGIGIYQIGPTAEFYITLDYTSEGYRVEESKLSEELKEESGWTNYIANISSQSI